MNYYDDELSVYGLVRDLYVASAVACFLWSMVRVARGVMLMGRVSAYDELEDKYTPEEREVLIRKIKVDSNHF